jgi:hypothetical protein
MQAAAFQGVGQLRNWAIRPEDAMLSLEEIAYRILAHDGKRNAKAKARTA